MTYSKLAVRNAKRQAKDYLVYFVTVVMAAALLYAFHGLVFSQELRQLSQTMEQLPMLITMASVVVMCIFGWLVSYSIRFMLSRRSRELGTYVLIGLENKQVARLFFLENLVVGGAALIPGLLLGGLLYQALRAIIMALFHASYRFSLSFSLSATGLTVTYFVLIYLNALVRSHRRIRKMKIYDLLYFERRNEEKVIRTSKKRRFIFAVSVVLGAIGTALLITWDLYLAMIGGICIIPALFGFFLSFASGMPAFYEKRPGLKYKNQNLLVFRTLTAKLATMGVLMAVISMVFTATLISEGSGLVFHGLFEGRTAENACFDLYLGVEDGRDPTPYLDYIHQNIPLEQEVAYQVYESGNAQILNFVDEYYYHYGYKGDSVLRYSDYAALRGIAGYQTAELKPGQYLIHCMSYLEEWLKEYEQPFGLGDTVLLPGGVYTEHLSQSGWTRNGRGYIVVIPDELAKGLSVHHWAYAAKTAQPVSRAQFYDLWEINERTGSDASSNTITTKANEEAEAAALTALFVFPLYFVALALTMTAATILTIQQLSESERYHRQFVLLRKLGMGQREMSRALILQLVLYYAMPAIPPVLISVPFIWNLANAPEPGVMVGMSSPPIILAISLGLFFFVYLLYAVIAYLNMKRTVLPE